MSEKPSKNPYASVLTKGMNHIIDDDFALVTNKSGETYLRKRWRRVQTGPATPEQVKAREAFSDAVSYARIHKGTEFYKEEATFRKKSAYMLALQDFHNEPTMEVIEIWQGSTIDEFRLMVAIDHPVALMELEAEISDVTTGAVITSGGMFIDTRDGGTYSLYFAKALLENRETVSVKLKLITMTERELVLVKSPVKVLKGNGSKTTKKP